MSRKAPRGLSEAEAALWAKVAASVTPLEPRRTEHKPLLTQPASAPIAKPAPRVKGRVPKPLVPPAPAPAPVHDSGLDSHWERRLTRASTEPDFTLDLHGHTLDQAHRRLDTGLMQAKAMGARLVLLITGKPRPVDAADRGEKRGAIRAKILDWLAAGPHGSDIAAVRTAHRRHGGEGALYLVLRRRR
ncbi:Smr/MutS family protein [Alteraurantiacibacter aquimixticola]|uniref:DNA mismatch repair protein MutS n=1 Tax=Alteraurantiacibacter aquimixticola TaxID=2489173 RepID=A0A4T3F1J3_9SPHN|nr:Smr/MutS family protein [Alteraurantiacibacter aquimixticola]TIX51063.1 DNA mismatch repair protein MutS [Alteraurantiacibacter aquimixticola]